MKVLDFGTDSGKRFLIIGHERQGRRMDYVRLSAINYVQVWIPGKDWGSDASVSLTLAHGEVINCEFEASPEDELGVKAGERAFHFAAAARGDL